MLLGNPANAQGEEIEAFGDDGGRGVLVGVVAQGDGVVGGVGDDEGGFGIKTGVLAL